MSFHLVSFHLLWTSADSLIAAFALSFVAPRRLVLPLIAMFGICDALGTALGVGVPVADGVAALLLASCGGLLILQLPFADRLLQRPGWVCVLPPLLAIDNLVARAADHVGLVALSSSVMAGLGFACGALVTGSWNAGPGARRTFAGACLLAAGSILAIGG
jgi:hypothetical protein